MGTSDEELTEAMAVAMTVGASKIRALQEKFMAPPGSGPTDGEKADDAPGETGKECST